MEHDHTYVPTQEDIDAATRVLQWAIQVSAGVFTGHLARLDMAAHKGHLSEETAELVRDAMDQEMEKEKSWLSAAHALVRHYFHHQGDRAGSVEVPKNIYPPMTDADLKNYGEYFKEPDYAWLIIRTAWEEAGRPVLPDGRKFVSEDQDALNWYLMGGEVEYRGYTLKAKRDFGRQPFMIGGHAIDFGFLVLDGNGTFCTPGASWDVTLEGAKRSADIQALYDPESAARHVYWDMLAYWKGDADKWAYRALTVAQQAAIFLQRSGDFQVRLDLSGHWEVTELVVEPDAGALMYSDGDLVAMAQVGGWEGAQAGRNCRHCETGILMKADPDDPDQTHICDYCGGRSDGGVQAARNEMHRVATALIDGYLKEPYEPAPLHDYAGEYYRWVLLHYGYSAGKAGDAPVIPEGDEPEAGKIQNQLDALAQKYLDCLDTRPAYEEVPAETPLAGGVMGSQQP